MILHKGERVFWGAPEVIYLEGQITALNEETQTVTVHVDRSTPHSAHLIGSDVPFCCRRGEASYRRQPTWNNR